MPPKLSKLLHFLKEEIDAKARQLGANDTGIHF
jgi:hypothetical protein